MMVSALLLALAARTDHGFDPDRLARIPAAMQRFVDEGVVAGTVVLVARRGETVLIDARGSARLDPNVPMREDSIFQVMSMTKPIVAMAAMVCAEEGTLRLDDPVALHLPEFETLRVREEDGTLREPARRLLVRHLLTHTGGFGSNDPAGLDDDGKRKLSLAEYVDLLAKEPLRSDPGERISYSGPGFAALGRVVEVASGMPLPEFLQRRVFGPLGMQETFFFLPPALEPRLAHVYYDEAGRLTPLDENPMRPGARYANPAGGLYSTARDMGRLIGCLANEGSPVLSPAGVRTMTTLQTGELRMDGSDALGYGLGFTVVRSGAGTSHLKSIGTFGHTGAFGTEFWADPKTGVYAVFMAQGFGNAERARKTFDTLVNAAFVGP